MQYFEIIKALREDHDLSQKEFGEIFGLSQNTISQYETNERKPTPELIISMAKHFDVSTDYLLGVSDKPRKFGE